MCSTSILKRPGELCGADSAFLFMGCICQMFPHCLLHPDQIHTDEVHNQHLSADTKQL